MWGIRRKAYALMYGASGYAEGDFVYRSGGTLDLVTEKPIPEGWFRIVSRGHSGVPPRATAIGHAVIFGVPCRAPGSLTPEEAGLAHARR